MLSALMKWVRCHQRLLIGILGFVLLVQQAKALSPMPTPEQVAKENAQFIYLLNRIGYGPNPISLREAQFKGIEGYIQSQLHPEDIAEPPQLIEALNAMSTLHMTPVEMFNDIIKPFENAKKNHDDRALHDVTKKMVIMDWETDRARLLRAVYSNRQLQEVMTDFWFNHFNVYSAKDKVHFYLESYEEQAIRPYALGRFRDLLGATAHHPAMLVYLDNWQNLNPETGRGRGLNENYARELMELHTLGVNGGYSQQDVVSLAKILTGWGLTIPPRPATNPEGFYFNGGYHVPGDKTLLGHVIPGDAEGEGEKALDILAKSPATAKHISYQLAQYFVADNPPTSLVNKLTETFEQTDGDIRAVLNTLFHSPEFWDPHYKKFKTPYQYVVSSVRLSGYPVETVKPLADRLREMGERLYACLTPDGYPNTKDAWLNPDAMVLRVSFASTLATGRVPLLNDKKATLPPLRDTDLMKTLGNSLSPETQAKVIKAPVNSRPALILASPDLMYR